MPRTIYLEYDEEILSVLQKIKKAGDDEVIVVAPKGARILRSLTTLRLLKEQSERLNKALTFTTADEKGRILARRAGLNVVEGIPPASSTPFSRPVSPVMRTRGMGDIAIRPLRAEIKKEKRVFIPQSKKLVKKDQPEKQLSELIGPKTISPEVKIVQRKTSSHFVWKFVVAPLAILVIVLGIFALYILPKAMVTVVPRTEPVTRDLEILVDSQSQSALPDNKTYTILGKKMTEELTEAKDYPATGVKKIGEKASGFVNLYNFSKTSLILKSGTTRLEAKGKIYYFLQDIGSIRPTARIGSDLEIDPSSLIEPVPIVAADAGEDYNLPAGTKFEVFNEVFGHQPDVLYAVNANPIAGGTNKEVKVVSDADVKTARDDLSKIFIEKFRSLMKDKLASGFKLADHAFNIEIEQETVTPPVGTQKDQFQLSQKVKVNVLVYNESDVRDLIVDRITHLLPEEKYLLPESQQTLTADFVSLDLGAGAGTLRAHFESAIRYRIDVSFLSKSLLGKTETQVKEILLARPEVEDVKVNLWPFWVKTVPPFENKLTIEVTK